jgi:hypothetical protein
MDILQEAKKRFERGFHSPAAEWEYLNSLMTHPEPQRHALLEWVFSESPAYWDTRARAGQVLLEENEEETWEIIERLVHSGDPDDNGTALTMFENLGDPRGLELAQQWLAEDAHLATQFEAIDFLWDIYPAQVHQRLQALVDHPRESVRRRARNLLAEFES